MEKIKFSELCGFTDKQWQATEAAQKHNYFLYGGSRGPGKSYWLRWYCIYRLLKWAAQGHKGVRVLLACEDYPTLRERQIVKIEQEFPPWLGRYYSGERKEFVLSDDYGGGAIKFGNLADVSNYLSAEYALIAIDELVRNSFSTFNKLRGSMRWPGISDVGFVGATNPEANWVRDLWVERRFEGEEYEPLKAIEDQFHFLGGLPTDNPHLDKNYWSMLNTLTKALRQAWVDGDWYAAVEGLVYDNFTEDNLTDKEPDPEQPIELAIDDGYIDPRATLFIQRSGTEVLVFDEIYHSKRLEEETIADIEDKCNNAPWAEGRSDKLPEIAAVSHEAVALRQRLRRADIVARNWMASKDGATTGSVRVEAIKLTRGLICDGQAYRTIKVHRRCKHLLDELTTGYKYQEGRRGINEKPADGNDHAAQALESWCWMRARR